ncbi:ABC transporter substrate-binding protein [Acetobacterium wieringae]|jgi:polar amino acid transport system substrate-binding protein|uniref:ABC transporter substrate-binding protein n=1 Tax=Acetobacterium wieringae TaxID=52694 RepID=A0A1F2PE29_9FIRM|nr:MULTISPECIES: ABC transporter substrate-binding protein [Acetobacterium]MEA4806912.1 ABC transporter substrate-binding protein [Acetobacterium wieringae]OFV69493.1 cystine-binding periplasmic protein precursor [Acetobacterium wieringae]OXS26213.1 MAG: amino acid ABC transporter [Acetobacterium sp. MES1]TYC87154.1 amino acid ABC transporter substrate-binding protein [Acetobacterium wieringae]URN86087.1 ABC transporter substrate-binding protein [Acetobacterium wieringae]
MKRKSYALVAIVLGAALLLTGCGSKSTSNVDPLADGVLTAGTNDMYLPLEFRDENNELVGFDIDLGQALADELGVEIKWVPTAWDGIFNGLNANQYDIVLSGTSITEERLSGFNMTDPYLANGIVIVSRKDATPAKTPKDLAGKTVGVQIETTADYAAEALKTQENVEYTVNKYDAMLDAFAALEGKQIDNIMTDISVAQFYTTLKPDVYAISSDVLSNEPIGITVRKADTAFNEQLNTALDTLRENGKLTELSMKWFGQDVTQNINTELKVIE